ncbi:MAG: hypothetical protein WCS52_02240 [bacterium]
MNDSEIRFGVFFAILVWGLLSMVVGYLAGQRGRGVFEFFLLSLLISPLLAFLIMIALPIKNQNDMQKVQCPHCHGLVDSGVKCCMHCRRNIEWRVTRQDFTEPEIDIQTPEPSHVAEFEGTIIECMHCRKMYSHQRDDKAIYAPCTHCGTHNPVKKKASPTPQFEADCPECGKPFPVRQGLGIIETLCPHCQSILKLDTAAAVA